MVCSALPNILQSSLSIFKLHLFVVAWSPKLCGSSQAVYSLLPTVRTLLVVTFTFSYIATRDVHCLFNYNEAVKQKTNRNTHSWCNRDKMALELIGNIRSTYAPSQASYTNPPSHPSPHTPLSISPTLPRPSSPPLHLHPCQLPLPTLDHIRKWF